MKLLCCGRERLLGVQERGSTIVEMRDATLRGEHESIGFAAFGDWWRVIQRVRKDLLPTL